MSLKEAEAKIQVNYPHLSLLAFSGVKKPVTIFCSNHKVKHTYTSYQMVRGCPECAKEKWREARPAKAHDAYAKAVAKGTNKKIIVLGKYVNSYTKIEHQCKACNTVLSVQPRSMLTHFGCRNCGYAKGTATGSQYKSTQLGNRVVKVQGGESEALEFITSILNVKPIDITVGSEGLIPGIHYTLKNKKHMYRPDFFLRKYNRIVEVKSTWYFGLTNKLFYEKIVAKAKACIAQGYEFRVIICNLRNSAPILLPKNWHTLTHKAFQAFWLTKYKLTLNGSLCHS